MKEIQRAIFKFKNNDDDDFLNSRFFIRYVLQVI